MAMPEMPDWMFNMSPEQFARLQKEQWMERRRDEIFRQGVHNFNQDIGGMPANRPRDRAPSYTYRSHISDMGDARIVCAPSSGQQLSISSSQGFEDPGYGTEFTRGRGANTVHRRNSSLSIAPPPFWRQTSLPRGRQRSRARSVQPEVIDLTLDGDDQSIKNEDVEDEDEQDPMPVPPRNPASKQATSGGRPAKPDATSKRRSRSVGGVNRPHKNSLRMSDIIQAPKVQEALQKKGIRGNGRVGSEKSLSDDSGDSSTYDHVAQDLADSYQDCTIAGSDNSDSGYPVATVAGADRPHHKNSASANSASAPSIHYHDSMPYAVPPLLRASSSFDTTTSRQRRKNLSVPRGGAAASTTRKDIGRIGVGSSQDGIRQSSVRPQSLRESHTKHSNTPKKPRQGGRLPFQQDSSSEASPNSVHSNDRSGEKSESKQVLTGSTSLSADLDQVDAEEHGKGGMTRTFAQICADARERAEKKKAAKEEAEEQKYREAEQRSKVRHDPYQEEMRQLGKEVGDIRDLSRPEGRAKQRAEKEGKQEVVKSVDKAAACEKRLKEVQAQLISKAKAGSGATITTSINVQNCRDSFHAKTKGESLPSNGPSIWPSRSQHADAGHKLAAEKRTPQHGTPPPHNRLLNGHIALNGDEPLIISSDESSSDGESQHDEGEAEFSTVTAPRSCLKRPFSSSFADEGGPSTPSKKVCVVTPSEEAKFERNAKRRLGGTLPKLPTESLQSRGQHPTNCPPAEKLANQQRPVTPKVASRGEVVKTDLGSNDEPKQNSTVTTPGTSLPSVKNGHGKPKAEENPLFVSETTGSDHSSDDEKREPGRITPEQRDKNEKVVRRRWEKKAEEKRAKGEDPGVFVHKPQGPYKKPTVEVGVQNGAALAATIEVKEKEKPKLGPKPGTNPVMGKIKQNVHQNAMERSWLFSMPQPQDDTPASSTSLGEDGGVKHSAPMAVDNEQTPKDKDGEMRVGDASLDDLVGENGSEYRNEAAPENASDDDVTIEDAQDATASLATPLSWPENALSTGAIGFVNMEHAESGLLPDAAEPLQNKISASVDSDPKEIPELSDGVMPPMSPRNISVELDFGDFDDFFNDGSESMTSPQVTMGGSTNISANVQSREQNPAVNCVKSNGLPNRESKPTRESPPSAPGELPPDRKFKAPSLRCAKKPIETSKVEPEPRNKNHDERTGGFLAQLQPLESVKEVPQTAAVFATTFIDDHVRLASSYEIGLSAPDQPDPVVAQEPAKMMSRISPAAQKPVQPNTNRALDPEADHSLASRQGSAPNKTAPKKINTPGSEKSSIARSSFQTTTSEAKKQVPADVSQSTKSSNRQPLQSDKARHRNNRQLPKIKKFLKKSIDDWVWVEAKQFLENGRCEPKDIEFFMNNRNALQDMLDLKNSEAAYDEEFREEESDQDESSEPPAGVTTKKHPSQTQAVAGRAMVSHRGEMVKQTATNGASTTSRKAPPIAEHKSRAVSSSTRTRNLQLSHPSPQLGLANGTHSTKPYQAGNQLPRRAPRPTNHGDGFASSSHRISEQARSNSLTEDVPARPTFGGKSINNPQVHAIIDKLKRAPEVELSSSVTTNDSETEEDLRGHYREMSPITEADEVHYEYIVKRKQWFKHEHEGDAEWFHVQAPYYESTVDAEEALRRETRILLHGVAFNPLGHLWQKEERGKEGLLEWSAEMHNCSMLLKVEKTMRVKSEHKLPASKKGWIPTKVWWIKKRTWRRYRRLPSPPQTPREATPEADNEEAVLLVDEGTQGEAEINGHDDGDVYGSEGGSSSVMQDADEEATTKEAVTDKVESEQTHAPQATTNDGDDDDERYELEYEGEQQHPDGIWTDVAHANKRAAEWYMEAAFDMGSMRVDDVKARMETHDEIKAQRKRLDILKMPLSMESLSEDGTKKISVWVEATVVNGPKNP